MREITTAISQVVIGTRGSKLALWQANYVKTQLSELGVDVSIRIIKTKGDKIQHLSFDKLEGKGFFTKEIEDHLLAGKIDLAVHSYKDLPTTQPPGLMLAGNSYRENPADWLVIKREKAVDDQDLCLPEGAVIGTSSARRKSQLLAYRPDLQFKDIRGNVQTRLKKLEKGWDAVVLAAAGLRRLQLDLSAYKVVPLSLQHCIPAAAQGVLAYQIRENNLELWQLLQKIHVPTVEKALAVERAILKQLGGGCQQPIGIYCKLDEKEQYHVWAAYSQCWKETPRRIHLQSSEPKELIKQAVKLLKKKNDSKKVFISRNLTKNNLFQRYMGSHDYEVYGRSLIQFSPIPFKRFPDTDWLFFSSKNSVKFFFEQQTQLDVGDTIKIGALGKGTANKIMEYGFATDFVGEGNDIAQIARGFAELASGQRVIFPQAKNSLQSIQKHLVGQIRAYNLAVYANQPLSRPHYMQQQRLPFCDVLVFTSPMNVDVYCAHHKISDKQKIVAIGPTTANALYQRGYQQISVAVSPDEISIADVCF